MIDTGLGDKLSEKDRNLMRVTPPPGGLAGAVERAGMDPHAITDVILTHLHFDHAGGATRVNDRGNLVPTFAQATYHVQRRALKWAEHAPEKDAKSFHGEDFQALIDAGRLHLLDGAQELFAGISMILSEGHTVAQQLPLIDGDTDGKLLYCADVIPTRHHIRLPWIMGFDLYPLTTLEEKRMVLAQGLAEGWTLFFEHDPQIAACGLDEKDGVVILGEPVAFS
ncbi:MAG: MBL fold metallo-hydrolase [Myxococcota bacterium]